MKDLLSKEIPPNPPSKGGKRIKIYLPERHKLPLYLLLSLCLNLVIAPLVYAASNTVLSRSQAWALGLLGLGAVAVSIYLFFVMFVPEKF